MPMLNRRTTDGERVLASPDNSRYWELTSILVDIAGRISILSADLCEREEGANLKKYSLLCLCNLYLELGQ